MRSAKGSDIRVFAPTLACVGPTTGALASGGNTEITNALQGQSIPMFTCAGARPSPLACAARLKGVLLALTVALGAAGSAFAAREWAPRMEQVARCSWDRPGHNAFMGEVVPAIDRYSDIPTPVRMRLKQRMQKRQYDDLVDIRRDSITGKHQYEPTIRDMHFGLDRVCRQVTRENWSARMLERGLVYCEAEHCILVPTVCRNVSRIERRPGSVAAANDPPSQRQAPTATSSAAEASAPPQTASSATAIAIAPATLGNDSRPASPSFAEGATGTALPLWPSSGFPSAGGASAGTPSGSWIAVAGGGLPTYLGPGTGGASGGSVAAPGRGSNPDVGQSPGTGSSSGGGQSPGAGSTPPATGTAGSGTPSSGSGAPTGSDGTPAGGSGTPTDGSGTAPGDLGGPLLGGDPAGGAGPGDPDWPGTGGTPILTDPIGGTGPIFVPGGAGGGAGPVPVSPVPEPSTWISLLIGLAFVAGATTRRRRASAKT